MSKIYFKIIRVEREWGGGTTDKIILELIVIEAG